MPRYYYKAVDFSGQVLSGDMDADSPEGVESRLIEKGYIPTRIGRSFGFEWSFAQIQERLTRIKTTDLILFTKQLRTMILSGVPMLALLQILQKQVDNVRLQSILRSIQQDVQEGVSLYDAFRRHPQVFSTLYCSMIRAGEASGELPEVLSRLSYIMEHEYKLKSDVRSALQYPLIVLVFLFAAFLVLLTFVIPRFVTIFEKGGIDLPIPTQICMMLYHLLFDYWYVIVAAFLGLAGLLYYFGLEKGKYVRDHLVMRLPLIGPLFIKAAMSRFASIFAILQFSGVAVLDSLRILTKTIGNLAIAKELDTVREQIAQGSTIAAPLKSAKYFTPMTVHMIGVGEASGNLDEMLREVSNHYDSEVAYAMDRLSEAIGPLLTILLAALVGFFALAIFLPMWDLAQVVK